MIGSPRLGWVLNFGYVWAAEAKAGREEGRKNRPCVLVLAITEQSGETRVRVLPVTHSAPIDPETAVEIPADVKRRLGLDAARSWIVCEEGNRFIWPGVDMRRVPGKEPPTIWHGPLPPKLFTHVQQRFLLLARKRRFRDVPRTE